MTRYYKLVTNRLAISECWRMAKDIPEFWTYLKMRFLMPPLPQETALGRPDTLPLMSADQVPPRARRKIDPIVAELESHGFFQAFHYTMPVLGPQEGFVSACLGRDTRMAAAAIYARQRSEVIEMEQVHCTIASRLRDGKCITTSNVQPTLNSPPNVESTKLPGQSVAAVVSRHLDRLGSLPNSEILPIANANELAAFSLHMNQVEIDDFIRRGIYAPMSDAEVTVMQAKARGNF